MRQNPHHVELIDEVIEGKRTMSITIDGLKLHGILDYQLIKDDDILGFAKLNLVLMVNINAKIKNCI